MDTGLSPEHQQLSAKAREFCEQVLQPRELEVEENRGLPEASRPEMRKAVCDWGFAGINHSVEDGGQGYSIFEQMLINEQLGRATCGLWAVVWQPAISLRFGTEEQKEQYLRPSCRGKRRGCFAITEPEAGSDPRRVQTEAIADGDGYRITGEKWFVTSYNASDYIIVHAHVDGDPDKPTLFLVDADTPGIRHLRSPHFMHTFIFDHAELAFEDVRVPATARLGEIGDGFALTKDWFVEARLQIAAHCVGAATRAAEVANDYAEERIQFDRPIRDFQAIEFAIANMATEIMAAKSLLYRVAAEITPEVDRKRIHARVSALKLFCSEMAGRVVDSALQVLGGRGYMCENPVERLYRDLRVDRIWEGTSEIQRAIIGGQIKKRGLGVYTEW
ncbi:MAG: acyl-CoA/acyl-ACP dehydrogenase [Deltaproteobacteria bacterium]|jgi:alkylation response protein AidB-like acyl-CoA dehydrogenase|nr:acyl-CoA/acyl-ACP dehydrogenase [Deltaproteobacteria bacterium]MBW2542795.1 acyl-CoA/acyl-ACP dehydrogenase [Deltaproteobacteria bacterium]